MIYSLQDFTNISKLGEGTYGVVFKCTNNITNEIVAIKKIKSEVDIHGISSNTLREIVALKQLIHPNIISFKQLFRENGNFFLVFEFLSTDLGKYLKEEGRLDSTLVKRFSYQIMQALLYCHSKRFLHRDLKPQNLLIDTEKNIIKLADFGLARSYAPPVKQLTHEVITLWYRPPEILMNAKRYSCGADMWSVGCIIAEMGLGKPLMNGDCEIGQLFAIFRVLGTPDEISWPYVTSFSVWKSEFPNWPNRFNYFLGKHFDNLGLDLLNKMLCYYPAERITVREALKHSYFDDVDKSGLPAVDEEKRLCPYISKFYSARRDDLIE